MIVVITHPSRYRKLSLYFLLIKKVIHTTFDGFEQACAS
jgi:hypothetical protein